jgi:hypothetical protein
LNDYAFTIHWRTGQIGGATLASKRLGTSWPTQRGLARLGESTVPVTALKIISVARRLRAGDMVRLTIDRTEQKDGALIQRKWRLAK